MNLRKKNNIFKVIIACLIVIGISLGYAVINSNINITGLSKIFNAISKIFNANWDIHFDNVVVNTNSVEIEDDNVSSAATIDPNDSTKVSFHVKLKEPGDFYEFTVDAVNEGSIDAMVDLTTSTMKIGNNEPVEITNETLPNYLKYYVRYLNR